MSELCRRTGGLETLGSVEGVVTRRALLSGAVLGSAAFALAGCGGPIDDWPDPDPRPTGARCVPASSLERHSRVGTARLVYEINGRSSSFRFEAGFHHQLDVWHRFWRDRSGLPVHDRIGTYGAWIDGRGVCDSFHHEGRAFDIARVGGSRPVVSARYDLWADEPTRARREQERRYWALAASLHAHFAYVLSYLYNDEHHNHLHVDNGRSGGQPPTFSGRSRVQNQAVQAICTHLWDTPVEITGRWDLATRRATAAILDGLQAPDDLTADGAWSALMIASTSRAGE